MPSSILIPIAIDHEALVARKLELARRLLDPGGRITLLTVLEAVPSFASEFVTVKMENHLSKKVRANLDALADGDPAFTCVVTTGKAGVKIVEYAARNGIDLVVVGAHHPTAMDYFLGSTAARVTRRAPCDVYVIRGSAGIGASVAAG